jgi:hypothetical protein
MATVTIVVTSNSDGTLTGTCSTFPEIVSGPHKSLKALMNWAKGTVFAAFTNVGAFVVSD